MERVFAAHIDRRDAQPVCIGVLLAGQDLSNDHAFQPAGNGRDFLHTLDFQASGREDVGNGVRIEAGLVIDGKPGPEPIEGNVHAAVFFADGERPSERSRI